MNPITQAVDAKAIELGKLGDKGYDLGRQRPSYDRAFARRPDDCADGSDDAWDPADPDARGSDSLVLPEGNAVPIIYAACADLRVRSRQVA